MSDENSSENEKRSSLSASEVGSSSLVARIAFEIPKPKDWQLFQRLCVLLFKDELRDPNAMEYGRSGQKQRGIDIIGRREGDPDQAVGIQCRRVAEPLRYKKILGDCREALKLEAGLREIIFATTAPDDVNATDDASKVQKLLREEGHDVTVVLYGWEALQNVIARHDAVYNVWTPSQVSTSVPQVVAAGADAITSLMSQLSDLSEQLRLTTIATPPREIGKPGTADEDPSLHARIDTFRDLFSNDKEPLLAQNGLLGLLQKESLTDKHWAHYRILANLGSIALVLGREAEAAERYEAAYEIRPDDPNAIANLALARTIQRRYPEAMELARKAMSGEPCAEHAVLNLLQAAARSDFQGDPEDLIPPALIGSVHADIGLAEFIGRRAVPGWALRTIELGARHHDYPEFRRMVAHAVLVLAQNFEISAPSSSHPVDPDIVQRAADDLKSMAEFCLKFDFSDRSDLIAYLGNAGMLLRLCGRHSECEDLLKKGLAKVGNEDNLKRLLALTQATLGRPLDGLQTLTGTVDPENILLVAELESIRDPRAALARVIAIPHEHLAVNLQEMRWRLIGELAIRTDEEASLRDAVEGLRTLYPSHVMAPLLEARWDSKTGRSEEDIRSRLVEIAETITPGAIILYRFLVAEEMMSFDMSLEASILLEPVIDIRRPGPTTTLYLKALAGGRRDEAFASALAKTSPLVRGDPDILWAAAAHSWNIGDLAAALKFVEELLSKSPDNGSGRLLKIEILLRQDSTAEVIEEFEQPIEKLNFGRLADRFRVASLLGHFGHRGRAAGLAYRLFLENQDKSQAWMTLSMIVLDGGIAKRVEVSPWTLTAVGSDAAVDLLYDDGEKLFFIVEPDPSLRALDNDSWEPDHPLIKTLLGQAIGDRFVDHNGREGQVLSIRHKYVARFHYVLENHERRFPEILGFRRLTVDVSSPQGLDDLMAQLKERRDWFQQEQDQYEKGSLPLAILAHRLGLDTIEVAAGLVEHGLRLKVAVGTAEEANGALKAISRNNAAGCVMDLLAFWCAWRMKALDAITAKCGTIHVPRSVVDRLQRRAEEYSRSRHDGLTTARYEAGKLSVSEVPAEVIQGWLDDTQQALVWIEENAVVSPVVGQDQLPEVLRRFLQDRTVDIFDAVVIAMNNHLLLVSDDLPTRQVCSALGWTSSTWLNQIFIAARNTGKATEDQLATWEAFLIDAGHSYVGVSYRVLLTAARLDFEAGKVPGYFTDKLASVLGGSNAEPTSHVNEVFRCIVALWNDPQAITYREATTGVLLRAIIRERSDYVDILRSIARKCGRRSSIISYIRQWMAGHFLPRDALDNL